VTVYNLHPNTVERTTRFHLWSIQWCQFSSLYSFWFSRVKSLIRTMSQH